MSETILTAENLKFRYDAEQPVYALDGVSAQVKRGEFVAVLGANGCGKSTLAKHFNAILLPEAGTVLVEGMDTRNEDHLYDVRQKVGMVFQNPDNQIVATIVEEDVAFAPENLGVPPEEIRTRIDEAMKLGCNHPIGPLALCDLIGLDVELAVMQVLYEGTKDPKYRPAPLLVEMLEAGDLGRKSGKGFFEYPAK